MYFRLGQKNLHMYVQQTSYLTPKVEISKKSYFWVGAIYFLLKNYKTMSFIQFYKTA
jgi:hypothetical protein